ncbi:MAG: class I SAM-dependent methyltransferase [Nitrososphaerales archaeon]
MTFGEEIFLDCRLRSLLQNPDRLLKEFGVCAEDVILDVGCGSGFLTIPAAELVGEKGIVYAIDIDLRRLKKLSKRAIKFGLRNIVMVNTDATHIPQIPNSNVNKAILFFSLHHIENRSGALKEIWNKVKPNGRVMMVEPINSRLLGHGTNPEEILALCKGIGFKILKFSRGLFTWKVFLRR